MQVQAEFAVNGRMPLPTLVDELKRQAKAKVDFVADARKIKVVERAEVDAAGNPSEQLYLVPLDAQTEEFLPREGFPIRMQALKQLGQHIEPNVPARFTENLATLRPRRAAELFTGLMHDGPKRLLIRSLYGQVRSFLSDSYRMIDHFDIAVLAMETVKQAGGEIIECSLTERNMRIKFTTREIWDAINVRRNDESGNWYVGGLGSAEYLNRVGARTEGDLPGGPGTIHPACTITNSETGHGTFGVRIGLLAAICFNLATVEQVAKQIHLGSKLDLGIFTADTIRKENVATIAKVRDSVGAAFTPEKFKMIVDLARAAQDREIKAPRPAVENIAKLHDLSEDDQNSILDYFIQDYDRTQYGLAQAVARAAQDTEDPDKAETLEDLAGKLLVGKS